MEISSLTCQQFLHLQYVFRNVNKTSTVKARRRMKIDTKHYKHLTYPAGIHMGRNAGRLRVVLMLFTVYTTPKVGVLILSLNTEANLTPEGCIVLSSV